MCICAYLHMHVRIQVGKWYDRLNVYATPKLTCCNSNLPMLRYLEVRPLERYLGCEGGALMNGISALTKRTPENSHLLAAI